MKDKHVEEPEKNPNEAILERLVIGFLFVVYLFIFVKILFL